MAQPALAQDTKTVLANASKAMGADDVTSVTLVGSGANYNLGQSNNPWALASHQSERLSAHVDLSQPASGQPVTSRPLRRAPPRSLARSTR